MFYDHIVKGEDLLFFSVLQKYNRFGFGNVCSHTRLLTVLYSFIHVVLETWEITRHYNRVVCIADVINIFHIVERFLKYSLRRQVDILILIYLFLSINWSYIIIHYLYLDLLQRL